MSWYWPFRSGGGVTHGRKKKNDLEAGHGEGKAKETTDHDVISRAARELCRRICCEDLKGFKDVLKDHKKFDVGKILLEPVQKVQVKTKKGNSIISVYNFPLGFAMEKGNFDVCKFLIEELKTDHKFFEKSSTDSKYPFTAIHCAAINSDPEIFKLLIKSEIVNTGNINIKTPSNNTPLHFACNKNSTEMVDLLIKEKADYKEKNINCELPLHWAAAGGNVDTFNAIFNKYEADDILENRALIDAERKEIEQKLSNEELENEARKLVVKKRNKNFGEDCLKIEATKLGVPLLFAAKNRKFDCISRILDLQREADGTCRDEECDTALHFVSRTANPQQVAKILKANALLGCKNEVGNTPLDWISPVIMEEVLDKHIQRIDKRVKKGDVSTKDQYEILFTNLFGHHASGSDMKNILALATSERHQELALHPVCQSVLSAKWQKMKKYYVIKLMFFIPFIVLLSVYPVMLSDIKHADGTLNISTVHEQVSSAFTIQDQASVVWYCLYILLVIQVLFGTLSVVVLISPFLSETRTLMAHWNKKRVLRLLEYYYSELLWSDWYEYVVWVLAFLLLHDLIPPIPVVIFSWFCLFIVCSSHPSILPFRYILVKILFRYIKFLIFAFGLISGFAMGFFLLLRKCSHEGKPCVDGAFANIYSTALKVPAMMMGEFSFEAFPLNHDGNLHVYFLFGGFIFLITCCLFNMMNGLAINITQEMMKKAHIFKTIAQCEMIYEFEVLLKQVTHWIKQFGLPEIKCLSPLWVERLKASPSSGRCKNLDEITESDTDIDTDDLWETNKREKAKWKWIDRGYVLDRKIIYQANAKISEILEKEKSDGDRKKNVEYQDPADEEHSDDELPRGGNNCSENISEVLKSRLQTYTSDHADSDGDNDAEQNRSLLK